MQNDECGMINLSKIWIKAIPFIIHHSSLIIA